MYKSKILVGIVISVYVFSVVFQFTGHDFLETFFRAILLPLIAAVYFLIVKRRSVFFTLFLLSFALSDLLLLIEDRIPFLVNYYLGNGLYILAYLFLLIEISKSISLHHVLKNFKLHIIVLTALNVYIVYVLQVIVNPFLEVSFEYYVELAYNIIMLLVLSASLMNYIYRDNKKALFLFVGSLAIVFSEVIGVAYLYISNEDFLNFLSTTLLLVACYFFIQQAKLENGELKRIVYEE